MLGAGASAVTITPPLGSPIAGLFTHRHAEAIDDNIMARALVLDNDGTQVALIICDLICLAASTATHAKVRITERTGMPPDHVMISCTHTHTGPATVPLLVSDPEPAYLDWLSARIADAVEVACSRLVPARIAYGTSNVDGVCFNRRYRMRDGSVVFNPGIDNPNIIEPAGPVDPEVTALLVERDDGEPIALWANLSLHYVGTDDPHAISADYYGEFARVASRMLGTTCIGMLTNGTSGNINNIDVNDCVEPVSGRNRAALVATAVAATAINATMMRPRHNNPTLRGHSFPFQVVRRQITAEDISLAKVILADANEPASHRSAGFSFVMGQPIPADQMRAYAREVLELAEMPAGATTEVQVMCIDGLGLAALPGEIFVEFGLAIKQRSGFDSTAIVSLANDYIGYVPTKEAFDEGGYETWAARSAWCAQGTGETLSHETVRGLREVERRVRRGNRAEGGVVTTEEMHDVASRN